MIPEDLAGRIMEAVLTGDGPGAQAAAEAGVAAGHAPEALVASFITAIQEVGRLWEAGDFFLPELVAGGEAVQGGIRVLEGHLARSGNPRLGRVAVVGTVKGDVHDIGKSLVGNLLMAHGFDVVDLGVDVEASAFADAVARHRAVLVGLSALLTTTMAGQKAVIEELARRGLREGLVVLVGGAPVTARWAQEIGADGTAGDAVSAAALATELVRLRGGAA
jgi:methanogenic corrinoid protein MtbC1